MGETGGRWNRRAFIRQGTRFLLGTSLSGDAIRYSLAAEAAQAPRLRIGLVTDLHHADRSASGTRYYRETLGKFAEAAGQFAKLKTDFVVGLGDLIDAAETVEGEKEHARRMAREFRAARGPHHFVLGNHCVWNLAKQEFLEIVGQPRSHYSFDQAGYHFVILDACYRTDGQPYGRKNYVWTDANIPPAQLDWLRADLQQAQGKSIVFLHQPLDMEPPHGVRNAPAVRQVLEQSGKVVAVIQGHYHRGGYHKLGGIHYCTLSAMIEGSGPENNAYAVMDLLPGDTIRITGFRKQPHYEWA